jgi:hypothetical protein
MHTLTALMALPVALLCWVGPFYLLTATGFTNVMAVGDQAGFSSLVNGRLKLSHFGSSELSHVSSFTEQNSSSCL